MKDDDIDDLIGKPLVVIPEVVELERDDKGRFGVGNAGGPGRPKSVPTEVAMLSRAEMQKIGMLLLAKDYTAIQAINDNPGETAFRVMLASVCLRIIRKGDMHALDILLNRLIGKVRDEIAVSGDLGMAPQIIVTLPANGREAKNED